MTMRRFYIPYNNDRPALLNIHGHKVLVLATDEEAFEESERLDYMQVRALDGEFHSNDVNEIAKVLPHELITEGVSDKEHICVVIANQEIDVDTLLNNVEEQLPWVH